MKLVLVYRAGWPPDAPVRRAEAPHDATLAFRPAGGRPNVGGKGTALISVSELIAVELVEDDE